MRLFGALAVLIGIVVFSAPAAEASTLPPVVNAKHVMWGTGQGYPSAAQVAPNNLIYHGGLVETTPSVYLVYWGPEWQQGFSFTAGSFTYTNTTNFILTPPGHGATAYGTVYCAYHAETAHTSGHGVRYAFMPYVPEQGGGCGANSVNQNDAFGHGYLDGYSIVAGHEYAEAVTDPDNQLGTQDGWNDISGSENGDKYAWTGLQNISLGGNNYAVQPLWSNEAAGGQGACAVTR